MKNTAKGQGQAVDTKGKINLTDTKCTITECSLA